MHFSRNFRSDFRQFFLTIYQSVSSGENFIHLSSRDLLRLSALASADFVSVGFVDLEIAVDAAGLVAAGFVLEIVVGAGGLVSTGFDLETVDAAGLVAAGVVLETVVDATGFVSTVFVLKTVDDAAGFVSADFVDLETAVAFAGGCKTAAEAGFGVAVLFITVVEVVELPT